MTARPEKPSEVERPPRPKKRAAKKAAKKPTRKHVRPRRPPPPAHREKPGGTPGPQLVEQPHGGRLWQGGHPNPTPGTGRPPDTLRVELRDLAAGPGKAALAAILDDPDARPSDKLKALEVALRYGLGTSDEQTIEVANTGDDAMRALRQALLDELERLGVDNFVRELQEIASTE